MKISKKWGYKILDDGATFLMGEVEESNIGDYISNLVLRLHRKDFYDWSRYYFTVESMKRSVVEHNACLGITEGALKDGIVKGCLDIIKNQTQVPEDNIWRWMNTPVYEGEAT